MKRILIIVGAVFGVLVIAAMVVPFLVPNSVYKTQIEKAATSALGRDVALNGDVSISLFPRIAASVEDVTVDNPDGFTADHMIEAGALKGVVKWGPLLARRVEIDTLSFVDATVQLERLEDGRANWEFGAADESAPEEDKPAGDPVSAGIGKARLENTNLFYSDAVTGQSYALEDFTAEASLQALDKPLKAKGEGRFQEQAFDFDINITSLEAALAGAATDADIDFASTLADFAFDGAFALGETPSAEGGFTVKADDLQALAAFADAELPISLAPLGALNAKGSVNGALTQPSLRFDTLNMKGDLYTADYKGGLSLSGGEPSLDGSLTANVKDATALAKALDVDAPGAGALKAVEFYANLSGPASALSMNEIDATHSSPMLNARYLGALSLASGGRVDGKLNAQSDDLRALLTAFGVTLAPGDTLRNFSLNAAPKGAFNAINLGALDFKLDDVSATGQAGVDLSGARPKVTATLALPALDLTPFMSAGETAATPKPATQGWSKEPLDLAGLKAVDADLDLKVGELKIDKITLREADMTAKLTNGALTADIAKLNAFGGAWSGAFGLDARQATPRVTMDLTGSSIAMTDMLSAFTGLKSIEGVGQLNIDVTSTGQSLDAIVRGLNGAISTNLADGAVKGVDAAKLVRSASDIRSALAGGDLGLALSPNARTEFAQFDSVLTIQNGVANVDVLKLLNPVVGLDGGGKINLGDQSLDLSILTSIDKKASGDGSTVQLNGIPVPFRLKGSWLKPSISPDTRLLQQALTSQLETRARDELNNALSNALGVKKDEETEEPAEGEEAPEKEEPKSVEDTARDAARDALGDLLNRNRN